MDNIRCWMNAQAICDSLTLRSVGELYFFYVSYGIYYVAVADKLVNPNKIEILGNAKTFAELVEVLLDILENKVSEC